MRAKMIPGGWPRGASHGPGTIVMLQWILDGRVSRSQAGFEREGLRALYLIEGENTGSAVRKAATSGLVREYDDGPPVLTDKGMQALVKYRPYLTEEWLNE